MKKNFIFAVVITMLVCLKINAAPIDCRKAKSKTEKIICSDTELKAIDGELSQAYTKALLSHPLPDYVKARQLDWLELLDFCDPTSFKNCIRKEYLQRIKNLSAVKEMMIYSNTEKFYFARGDAVVELWKQNASEWHLSIWGGFALHRGLSEIQGREIFTGCEFEGTMTDVNSGKAFGKESKKFIYFFLDYDKFIPPAHEEICSGFGRIAGTLLRRK